jgi:ATP-dependent Clp protease protease subunit
MSEIFIYDDIGPDYWGLVSAKMVMGELKAIGNGKPVTVRVNSPGGDVIEAQAIYNALRRHSEAGGTVTIEIDALAASAASYIAMAGDEIRMAENAMMMIHKAWTIAMGNADDLRTTAGTLDKFDGILADTYVARTGRDREEVMGWLEAETWLTAKESMELGFADAIGTPLNISASIKPGRYAKTPAKFLGAVLPREQDRQNRLAHAQRQIDLTRRRQTA